jgi:hypothetical protein
MILPRIETVLKNYIAANFQAAADPLYGVAVKESETGAPWITITAQLVESELLYDAGNYTAQVMIKLLAPAAQQSRLNAYSREIENIFAPGRLEAVLTWINSTQSAVNVACNALDNLGPLQDGKVPDREQVGVIHTLEGLFYVPADEVLTVV